MKLPFSFLAGSSLGGTTAAAGFLAAFAGSDTFSSTGTLKSNVHIH